MGHSKLNICLLLIVAGTAAVLGSPAKQEPPQMSQKSQDERLPSNLNDYENKVDNGTAKRTAILTSSLKAVLNIERTITFHVVNKSGKEWQAINIYFNSGTSDDIIPLTVPPGETLQYSAHKGGISLKGVSGVMAYNMNGITLTIMFKVPNLFQGLGRKNRWNVELKKGIRRADKKTYKNLKASPFIGDGEWRSRKYLNLYTIWGAMSNTKYVTLKIEVRPILETAV